ncbi:unnamed protein product, partial [Strongylus vulgaris]
MTARSPMDVHRAKHHNWDRKPVDIELVLDAREKAREQMLNAENKKLEKDRAERMKNRVIKMISTVVATAALEKAGTGVETQPKLVPLKVVPSPTALGISKFSILNVVKSSAHHRSKSQGSPPPHSVHAAGSYKKHQAKVFIPPPSEEFDRNVETQSRAFAIENEVGNAVRQRLDVDNEIESQRIAYLFEKGVE